MYYVYEVKMHPLIITYFALCSRLNAFHLCELVNCTEFCVIWIFFVVVVSSGFICLFAYAIQLFYSFVFIPIHSPCSPIVKCHFSLKYTFAFQNFLKLISIFLFVASSNGSRAFPIEILQPTMPLTPVTLSMQTKEFTKNLHALPFCTQTILKCFYLFHLQISFAQSFQLK